MSTQVLRASNPPGVSQVNSDPGTSNRLQKKGATTPAGVTTTSKAGAQNFQSKKMTRKTSKPILTWFQRKLGGSVKTKRTDNGPIAIADLGLGRSSQAAPRGPGRAVSSPFPQPANDPSIKQAAKRESGSVARRTTFSLTEDEGGHAEYPLAFDDGNSIGCSSYARDSLWSPTSVQEADDDASLRPIPPSAPPSPSPSRSSSSYLSDPRTFRSMAASTKPTTILSIDLGNPGMAHIAQVPHNAPANPVHRIAPHIRQSSSLSGTAHLNSANSITFSALPSSGQQSSRPPSMRHPGSISSLNFNPSVPGAQAPLHTAHHPRNNPRPSSPPLDNASMLTLASSAFAHPGRTGLQAYSITTTVLGDTASHYGESVAFPDGESTSQFHDDRLDERDVDASVRALRPRSSRRGSWESEVSRWSARVRDPGTPSLVRQQSLWTANSVRTGAFSDYRQDDDYVYDNDKSEQIHESRVLPSILVGKDEDASAEIDHSSVERETLGVPEAPPHGPLHRPSTETIAQQTPSPSAPPPLPSLPVTVGANGDDPKKDRKVEWKDEDIKEDN
ncbi:hypothetical protein DFP72DRAFT_570809 [Ephemerocybe angulata]|uniref:Uncharacterized protein n=1 Tax=Ephemerocybe angulata TaxID=980116 RepID=A0A8H6IC85_9AGAR|nr:hypothetical protein DFP72DRAFT_570809 [Tulosesus angulatus]